MNIASVKSTTSRCLSTLILVYVILLVLPQARAQLDTIQLGNAASETAHNFASVSTQVRTGQFGQSARIIEPLTPLSIYGGNMSFTMQVDPYAQNYFTLKVWGGEGANNILWMKVNGYLNTDWPGEWNFPAINKFLYRTMTIPLWQTRGQTSVTINLLALGNQNYYQRLQYDSYQWLVSQPMEPLYVGYTHTDAYFTPPANDLQAPPAPAFAPATPVNVASQIASMQASENSTLKSNLAAATLNQSQIGDLATGYTTSWTSVYQNPAVTPQIVRQIDLLVATYYGDNSLANSEWGGGFYWAGLAIKLMYPQLAPYLDQSTGYGVGGTLVRRNAWSAALRADVDQSRFSRKTITNQAMAVDYGIYLANRAIELIDPNNALPEAQAQDYFMQSCGMEYYKGSDLPGGGSSYPWGPNYWMMTPKGGPREQGWTASDYGIGTVTQTEAMYEASGNPAFLNRALQILHARAAFEYPANDGALGNGNGYYSMVVADEIGYRNTYEPGRAYYVDIATAGASLDPAAVGYIQQAIADNKLLSGIGLPSVYVLSKYYPIIAAQPQAGIKLPLSPGQPDYAFADELDQVVAIKHGDDSLFFNLYWSGPPGITGFSRAFLTTPTSDRAVELQVDDESFTSTGTWATGSGASDSSSQDVEPDTPIASDYGVHWMQSTAPGRPGAATGYTVRYGTYLVGMNSDENNTIPYKMKLPSGFTSGLDLISGQTLTAPVVLQPQTSAVFILPGPVTGQQLPSRPTFFTSTAANAQVALAWDPPSNGITYNLYRGGTSGGPYTVIASSLSSPQYTDTTVSNGTTYYYVVTGVNPAGESAYSPEQAVTLLTSNLVVPWAYLNIGGGSGTANFDTLNALHMSTSTYGFDNDLFYRGDQFSYVYQALAGDGTVTARLASMQNTGQCGIIMRNSLAANSNSISFSEYNGGKLEVGIREPANSTPAQYQPTALVSTSPYWMRIVRAGMNFTVYGSIDGVTWMSVDNGVLPTASNTFYIGLGAGRSANCVFDHISASGFNSAATAIAVNANPTKQIQGYSVTLTAQLAAAAQTSLTGVVSFYDGQTLLGTSAPGNDGSTNFVATSLSVGKHNITATYTGDKTLQPSVSSVSLVTISELLTPTVAVTSSLNPAPGPGEVVSYTATATFPSNVAQLNGRMYVYDGSTQIATNIVSQQDSTHLYIQFPLSNLAVGNHNLTTYFDGSGTYGSATSPIYTQVITATKQVNPKFLLSASPTAAAVGTSIVLSGVVSGSKNVATGSMVLYDNGSSTPFQTVSLNAGGSASFATTSLAAGIHMLTASYAGDTNYFPATSNSVTVNVSVLSPVLTLSASQNPLIAGTNEVFNVSVGAFGPGGLVPTGSVKFYDGTTLLGLGSVALVNGSAALSVTNLAPGKHNILSTYSGDSAYAPANASAVVLTVGYASSLVVAAQPQSAVANSAVQITATASGSHGIPTGTISFFDGSSTTPLQTVPLNSNAAASFSTNAFSTGQHTISASYSGDSSYLASSSTTLVTVTQAGTAVSVSLSAAQTSIAAGSSDTFTANVQPALGVGAVPTGSITFFDGTVALGGGTISQAVPLTNGVAVLTTSSLTVGSHSITAFYSGDALYAPSTSALAPVTVVGLPLSATVTLSLSGSPVVAGATETFTMTVHSPGTPVPTGTIALTDTGGVALAAIPLVNGSATYSTSTLASGTHILVASYNGDAIYAKSSASVTLTVTPASPQDFSVTFPAVSLDIGPTAAPVTAVMPVTAQGGFNQTVEFACSVGSAPLACSLSPSSVTLATGVASTTLTVGLIPMASVELPQSSKQSPLWAIALTAGLFGFMRRRELRHLKLLAHASALIAILSAMSCLSGCGTKVSQVEPTSYNFTVTATSGQIIHTGTIQVNVHRAN